ncbi:HNH endonuclease [Micromonospora zamorensis]|uniref:HNH endonuclease n=1 Tax=Micromonospora zamorensis TaxID=709883 RepID=UPI003D96F9A2
MRKYAAKVRERDGVSLTQRYRPAKNVTCDWCAAPVRSNSGRARDGLVLCQRHRTKKRDSEAEREWISRRDRLAIYERDGWICQLCFEPVDREAYHLDDWAPSLDHIIPRSHMLIPDHSPSNLRLAHRWCNAVRGDGTYHGDLFKGAAVGAAA